MKPAQVTVNVGTPPGSPERTSSEFEEVNYPPPDWASTPHHDELPLHYMTEDKARRRVAKGPGGREVGRGAGEWDSDEKYSDDGKGMYSKSKMLNPSLGTGRQRQVHQPPPTTIVSSFFFFFLIGGGGCLTVRVQTEFLYQNMEHITPAIYTLLSCWTRYHRIGTSNSVVWDEAHFGKFGSHYLKREFYFDVHPPLGKMLVGLVGLLAGYDGQFDFKSGEAYPEGLPYTSMRVMLATFGVALVPLGWYTAVELGMSTRACHLVALMCLCGTFS